MIDTAATVRDLENAGADHKLAEAIVTAIVRNHQDVATKTDLEQLDTRFGARISDLRADVLTAIAGTRTQTLAGGVAIAGVLFAAIAALNLF